MKQHLSNLVRAYRHPLGLDNIELFNFFPLSYDPPVVFHYTGWNLAGALHILRTINDPRTVLLIGCSRYRRPWHLVHMRRQLRRIRAEAPVAKVLLLANSHLEMAEQTRAGFEGLLVPNNAFQREDLFSITHEAKRFDAVMNARMARWKRMELAREIERLAIITIREDQEYLDELRRTMPRTYWPNFERGEYRYLTREEVSSIVNGAHAGLILSATEGNNRASIEYLLSGVPVVSTYSKGGREMFFKPEYATEVPPEAPRIREAVEAFVRRAPDPEWIRADVLNTIRQYRQDFLDAVHHLSGGVVESDADQWTALYPNNLEFRCDPGRFDRYWNQRVIGSDPSYTSEKGLKEADPELWNTLAAADPV